MYYSPDVYKAIAELLKYGYNFAQIAQQLQLTEKKLNLWLRRYPDLAELMRCVTDPIDNQVEAALLKRALGYEQQEVYCEDIVDKKSGEVLEELKRKTVIKQVPPDVRAAMAWLQNRRPQRWKSTAQEADNNVPTDPEDADLL